MTVGLACWRCEAPGHTAAECQPPPAATRKELHARIDRYRQRWEDGDITLNQKRKFIAAEMRAFNGKAKAK